MSRQEHEQFYLQIKPDRYSTLLPDRFEHLAINARNEAEIPPLIQTTQSLKDYENWLKSLRLRKDLLAQFDLKFPLSYRSADGFPSPQLFLEAAGFALHPFLTAYAENQENSYSAIRTGADFASILYFFRLMHEGKVPWKKGFDETKKGKIKKGYFEENGRQWEVYCNPGRSFSLGFRQKTEGKGSSRKWVDSRLMRMDTIACNGTVVLELDLEAERFQPYTKKSIDVLESLFGPNRHHVSLGDGRAVQCELIVKRTMIFLGVADFLL